MKTFSLSSVLAAGLCSLSLTAFATPTLQLDIDGGTYVGGDEESTLTTDPVFDLYAYATPGNVSAETILDTTYFLSIAISPRMGPEGADLGTFSVNGTTYNATSDMVYGNPPLAVADVESDLPGHGIYDTYYLELAFMFDPTQTATEYNVQEVVADTPDTSGSGMFYEMFNIDMTGLNEGIDLHFDLYSMAIRRDGLTVDDFAPFSHDAGTRVPEPASLGLLGLGLIGLGTIAARRQTRA